MAWGRSMFKIKNIYEPSEDEDGFRIFVERSWPEGLSKNDSNGDLWLKEIAPAKDICEGVTENSVDFKGFKKSYRCEL
jgi:uncharacterized protein YeaO (DUF488 family)